MDIEEIDKEFDSIESCPNCYTKGRNKGIVIGAIAVGIVMIVAHFIANGVMYWK